MEQRNHEKMALATASAEPPPQAALSSPLDLPESTTSELNQSSQAASLDAITANERGEKPAPPKPATRRVTGWKWAALVVSILACVFLHSTDSTILANSRPPIIEDLGHIEKLPWISVAYVFGSAGVASIWWVVKCKFCSPLILTIFRAKAYTQFDGKIIFCMAVLIFDIGTAVSGSASTMNVLIVGRVIGGAGGVGMYSGSLQVLSGLALPQERALTAGATAIGWSVGTLYVDTPLLHRRSHLLVLARSLEVPWLTLLRRGAGHSTCYSASLEYLHRFI